MRTATKPTLFLPVMLGLLACLIGVGPAAGTERRNVLAHGGDVTAAEGLFWVAVIETGTVGTAIEQSRLYSRQMMEQGAWQAIPPLPARTLSISSQGAGLSAEALLLLENKAQNLSAERIWAWYSAPAIVKNEVRSEGRYSYGPVLPKGAKPLAIAAGRNLRNIWAIGKNLASTAPASRSATTQSASAPTQFSLAPNLGLFLLEGQEWTTWQVNWPVELDDDQEVIPMIVINDSNPVIATHAGDQVRLYELSRGDRAWRQIHAIKIDPAPRHIKLINIKDSPALWLQSHDPAAIGTVWTPDRVFKLGFTDSGALPAAADMDVTFAGDEIRLVFQRDKKLYEKRYSQGGSEAPGGLAEIVATNRVTQPPIHWVTTAIMAVFTVLIISTLLRRRAAEREDGAKDRQRDRDDEE